MTNSQIETKLEELMLSARSTSDVGSVVTCGGVLAIAITLYSMLPSWHELKKKEEIYGAMNAYWLAKVIACVVIIICTILLVRMMMHSKENTEAAGDVAKDIPFIAELRSEIASKQA